MSIKDFENVYANYHHFNDNRPVNITAVGESFWQDDCCFERAFSDITAIEFVVSGCGVLETEGIKYDIGSGDVFLLRKGTHHKYYNNKNCILHKYFVTLTGELPEILLDQYLPGNVYVYHGCDIEMLFRSIYERSVQYGENYALFVDDMTPEIIKLIISISNFTSESSTDVIYQMKEFLDSQVYKSFSLDFMCREFGYSKNHIINKFSEAFGITPYQYYTLKKLETVKLYLLNTGYSLSEISDIMSFADQQYFSAWFKSLTGEAPSKYRKEHKDSGF